MPSVETGKTELEAKFHLIQTIVFYLYGRIHNSFSTLNLLDREVWTGFHLEIFTLYIILDI